MQGIRRSFYWPAGAAGHGGAIGNPRVCQPAAGTRVYGQDSARENQRPRLGAQRRRQSHKKFSLPHRRQVDASY